MQGLITQTNLSKRNNNMRLPSAPNPILSSILAVAIILAMAAYWAFSGQTPAVKDKPPAAETSGSQEVDAIKVSTEASAAPVVPDALDETLLVTPQEGTSN